MGEGINIYDPKLEAEMTEYKLNLPISSLGLSAGPENILIKYGFKTVGQLTHTSDLDLMNMRNFGYMMVDEVKEKLAESGLSLKD